MNTQELIALGAVAMASLFLGARFFRSYMAEPLSRFFLKRNQVRAAMWARKQVRSGCADCGQCETNAPEQALREKPPARHSAQND